MGPCQDLQWTGGRATLRFCVRLPEVVARQGETSCDQEAAATMGETVLAPMTGLMFSHSLSRSLRRKNIYTHICVYIYIMYMNVYIYTYVYIYVYIYIYIQIYKYKYICLYIYIITIIKYRK